MIQYNIIKLQHNDTMQVDTFYKRKLWFRKQDHTTP